jgi:hypothetical protein
LGCYYGGCGRSGRRESQTRMPKVAGWSEVPKRNEEVRVPKAENKNRSQNRERKKKRRRNWKTEDKETEKSERQRGPATNIGWGPRTETESEHGSAFR